MYLFDEIRLFEGRPWNYIIIHHSATSDGRENNWDAIKKWHTGRIGSTDSKLPDFNPYIANPMIDIGYHFGVEQLGDELTYRIGRPLSKEGAHCLGKNTDGIGICLVGNYDLKEPSKDQYRMLADLCRILIRKFTIGVWRVCPHRDFAPKTCPGKLFSMDKLKTAIQSW